MIPAGQVPAAHGVVQVKKDKDDGNLKLDVKVQNLAAPASLTPPESIYVVWIEPQNGQARKIGAFHVGSDLKGEVKATTTAKDFTVDISAEKSEAVQQPTGLQVLHVHITP